MAEAVIGLLIFAVLLAVFLFDREPEGIPQEVEKKDR